MLYDRRHGACVCSYPEPRRPRMHTNEHVSQMASEALADIEAWMDRQPLSRTGQPQETQDELAKLVTQAEVMGCGIFVDSCGSARRGYLQCQRCTRYACVCASSTPW